MGAKMGWELGFVEVHCVSVQPLIQAGVIMEIKTKSCYTQQTALVPGWAQHIHTSV